MDNSQRADSIRGILSNFKTAAGLRGEPDAEVIGDLLCNLAHFCDEGEIDLALALGRARLNYEAESRLGNQFDSIESKSRSMALDKPLETMTHRAVVVVSGGVVQSIHTDAPNLGYDLIDCDNLEAEGVDVDERIKRIAEATEGLRQIL